MTPRNVSRILFFGLLLILACKLALTLVAVRQLQNTLTELRGAVRVATQSGELVDVYPTVQELVQRGDTELGWLKLGVWPLGGVLRSAERVPQIGNDLATAGQLLQIGDTLFDMADVLFTIANPIVAQIDTELDVVSLVEQLGRQQSSLADLDFYWDNIVAARAAMPSSSRFDSQVETLDTLLILLEPATKAMAMLPDLIGLNEPHHVLLLFQNADELRPTGGFLTSTAYVSIENGEIGELLVLDSNDKSIDRFDKLAYGAPPEPMAVYMELPVWLLRDANWSPDYPTSAAQIAAFYSAARDVPVDTVIAVNQYSLVELLRGSGPITLSDGDVVSADSVIQFLHDQWGDNRVRDFGERKAFIAELTPAFIDHLLADPSPATAQRLLGTVQRLAAQRELFVYSADSTIQTFVEALGVDGAIPIAAQDYIHLSDANLGFNKVNLNIDRQAAYHVSLTDFSAPYAVLTVERSNRSITTSSVCATGESANNTYAQRATGCDINYLRLYVPDNSELLSAPAFPFYETQLVRDPNASVVRPIPDERGKEVFGGLTITPPNTSSSGEYVYQLDPTEIYQFSADTLRYSLTIQKQSGVPAYPFSIAIDLPSDLAVRSISPAPDVFDGAVAKFEVQLVTDFVIEVDFHISDAQASLLNELQLSPLVDRSSPAAPREAIAQPIPSWLPE